jgi:hypothetical protein
MRTFQQQQKPMENPASAFFVNCPNFPTTKQKSSTAGSIASSF